MPNPSRKKSGVIQIARTQPGPKAQRRQPVRGGDGGACGVASGPVST